jgi:hypothetical protein
MAQQAIPKVSGQSADRRLQLMTLSAVVNSPFQRSFQPGVGEAHDEQQHEDKHLDVADEPDLLQHDRPGKQEHRLDVEHHQQDCQDEELHPKAAPGGLAGRVHTALIGHVLRRIGVGRAQERGDEQRRHGHQDNSGDHEENRQEFHSSHVTLPRSPTEGLLKLRPTKSSGRRCGPRAATRASFRSAKSIRLAGSLQIQS